MANLFDYLAWRGDLPLETVGFNEVDGMILARFAYADFENAEPLQNGEAALGEVAQALAEQQTEETEDAALLRALAQSERFRLLRLSAYENRFDAESQTQFSAVTVRLTETLSYLAFRGTDTTLVGWKENFNMAFLCPVPSQREAADYLARAAEREGRLILGGHSKGGNLAVYAAAMCEPSVRERIEAVYNYDGPGFEASVLHSEGYRQILPRVHTFVPQSSIVGMLLEHGEKITVVHSTRTNGIQQHDVCSWEVLPRGFLCMEETTSSSRFIDATVSAWLSEIDYAQRKCVIDTVYGALEQTNAKTLQELSERRFAALKAVLSAARHFDEETKNAVTQTLRLLMRSVQKELPTLRRKNG
ncbi:MAG: DUF2974 domain-containing protein [Faecousia sp.]